MKMPFLKYLYITWVSVQTTSFVSGENNKWSNLSPLHVTCALPTKSSPPVPGAGAEENQWILPLSISLSVTRLWKTQGSLVGISHEERLSSHPMENLALVIPWHPRISRADLTLT